MGQALVASIGALAFVLAFLYKMVAIEPRAVMESKRWIGRIVFGTIGVELAGTHGESPGFGGSGALNRAPPLPIPLPLPGVDPAPMADLFGQMVEMLMKQGASSFNWVIEYYFLWTGNFHGDSHCIFNFATPACGFTGNDVVRGLYRLTAAIADATLAAIVTYGFMRSIFERSFRARYTLKAMLPRLLLVIVLVNFGLFVMQGAIDVNNGAVHAIWTYRSGLDLTRSNLWALMVAPPPYNLLLATMFMLVAVLLIVLAVTSVARNLLLVLLVAGAPMAFICLLLPELHSYAIAWRKLFLTTVFAQAAQVMVLRLSLVLLFQDHGFMQAIHGLVALFLVLKVPGALHAGSKAESKLMTWAHHGEKALEKGAEHAAGMHTRARAPGGRLTCRSPCFELRCSRGDNAVASANSSCSWPRR